MNETLTHLELPQSFENSKIMIYSHDTFGLGHLRRCREIAHALVEAYSGVSVLIVSGAAIAGAFDYKARVNFIILPSVIKLRNGEYTSMAKHIALADTLDMRRSLIKHTAESYKPDIFLVDKEPAGLRGELMETLDVLKKQGTRIVLGLREVLDAPDLLSQEWDQSDKMATLAAYYDTIWAYGPPGFHNPLNGLDVPPEVADRMVYTGYLRRQAKDLAPMRLTPELEGKEFILVTTGGGGDGAEIIAQVLDAYACDRPPRLPAVITLGPFLAAAERDELKMRGAQLPDVHLIDFDNRLEDLVAHARAVTSMAGYNTFCEILSFDRPSLLLPRTHPRQEQLIRAECAERLGLASMLAEPAAETPEVLARALDALLDQPRPSERYDTEALLGGLDSIVAQVGLWLQDSQAMSG